MKSLVKKLKSVVNDDSLRKIDEYSFEFGYLGNPSNSSNKKVEIRLTSGLNCRTYGDIDVETNGNSYNVSKIEDGGRIFFTGIPSNLYLSTNLRVKVKIEGYYNNILSSIYFSGVYFNLEEFPYSLQLSSFSALYLNYQNKYQDIDFEVLLKKFPNLTTLVTTGSYINQKNINKICEFNNLKTLTCNSYFYSPFDLTYLVNCPSLRNVNFDNDKSMCIGDYFGLINGKEKELCIASGLFKYNGETFEGSKLSQIGGTLFYIDGDVDQMLINLAANATKISGGANTIKISSYRTSASDSAIQTLQSKGWTISIPGGGRAAVASTMSVMSTMSLMKSKEMVESGKYRIAYQDSQLIIEPTEFPIYPAAGVTVKEFQALEEANEFISENNLSTEVE